MSYLNDKIKEQLAPPSIPESWKDNFPDSPEFTNPFEGKGPAPVDPDDLKQKASSQKDTIFSLLSDTSSDLFHALKNAWGLGSYSDDAAAFGVMASSLTFYIIFRTTIPAESLQFLQNSMPQNAIPKALGITTGGAGTTGAAGGQI